MRLYVGYNYLIEFFTKDKWVAAGTGWCCFDACIFSLMTLYFWKIGSDWDSYFYSVIICNSLALLGTLYLPESPRMLIALGKEAEAIESLQKIARCNGYKLCLGDGDGTDTSS